MWGDLAFLYIAFLAYMLLFVLGCLAVAGTWSITVTQTSVGAGPAILRTGRLVVRLLPISASVRFFDNRDPAVEGSDENGFDRKPLPVRVIALLAGPTAALLGAFALRGTDAFASLARGFDQIFAGAIAPHVTGVNLVNGLLDLAARTGYVTALGALFAKVTAFNLLPIPLLSGGGAILEMLLPNRNWPAVLRLRENLQKVGLLILLPLWISWLFALALALYGRMSGG